MEDRGWDQVDFVAFWRAGAIKWELSLSPTGAGRRVLPYLESLALASL